MTPDPDDCAAADYMAMQDKLVLEIQAAAKVFFTDLVKEQIANGKPASGITKSRHAAIVAKTLAEMIDSFSNEAVESADPLFVSSAQVMQATLLGTSLLNASQLRQELEKAGVLKAQGVNLDEY